MLDFFNLLKAQFIHLRAIPINPVKVFDGYNLNVRNPKVRAVTPFLQKIYWDHGWPGLERYHKKECLETVEKYLREQFDEAWDNI